nr:sigma-E processing peptidase SpoIIGA [Geomicrobium sp. JCM 19037]
MIAYIWHLQFRNFLSVLGAVLLAFGFQTFWRLFKTVAAFYFISILSGGAVVAMSWFFQSSALVQSWRATSTWHLLDHMHALLVLSTIPVVLILSEIVKRAVKEDKKMMKKLVRVSIRMTEEDDWIDTSALVDTGNQLKDPISRKPVVLAEASIVRPLLDEASFAQFIEWIATDGNQGANLWMIKSVSYRTVLSGAAMDLSLPLSPLKLSFGSMTRER